MRQGLATADNPRFVRFYWEVTGQTTPATDSFNRWFSYAKGGGYQKWTGMERSVVDWEHDGARIKARINTSTGRPYSNVWMLRETASQCFFQPGLTYTQIARGNFGVRCLEKSIFGHASNSFFPSQSLRYRLLGLLNSRHVAFMLRSISQKPGFEAGHVNSIPICGTELSAIDEVTTTCVKLKGCLVSSDMTERSYVGSCLRSMGRATLRDYVNEEQNRLQSVQACLHFLEAANETLVSEAYGFNSDDSASVFAETGTPVGSHPLMNGYGQIPPIPGELPSVALDFSVLIGRQEIGAVESSELSELKSRLRNIYEVDLGGTQDGDDAEDAQVEGSEEDVVSLGSRMTIPPETFLEHVCQTLELHPFSAYWLLREGIEEDGWRCPPQEQEMTTDRLTTTVVHLLGHRWPKQIEAGEALPEWADPDGIIPLTGGADESTLLERVRERLAAEFEGGDVASVEREFAEIVGKPLDKWLTMEFFKHHTKQFKKRPIAWQIQSSKFTARKRPAFACLVYYHKLDGDLLPKIRNQYVGPLRSRLETELRSIESVSSDARSDRQEGRRGELQDQIDELRDFDAALKKVITEGFASKELGKTGKDEPLDKWCSLDGVRSEPENQEALLQQESRYFPDINDGVRVNIAPLQKAGLLAADVISKKDLDKAIADRAQWRADERRWCRENKLPQPGWWPEATE